MADVHTKEQRSYNMSCIKCKNTKPELLIRKALFAKGFRYSLHRKDLSGKPDIVLPKYKAVIFVNGCFFHYHECRLFKMPAKSSSTDWKKKLTGNRKRDQKNIEKLLNDGWRVLTVWECFWIGKGSVSVRIEKVSEEISAWIKSNSLKKDIAG